MEVQNQNQNEEVEIDLLEILFVLKARILVILASALAFATIMAAYSFFLAQPVYQSSSRLYILTKSTSITSLTDIQIGTNLTQDYKELVTSRAVVEQVIDNLDLNYTYGQMLSQISVENPTNTRILKITVQDNDPEDAKLLVDELTEVSRDRISNIMDQQKPSVVEYGNIPTAPISPNKSRNILIGFALGAFIACAVVIVLHLMDDTVKTADDVEKYLGLNTLTSIPLKEGEEKKGKKKKKKKKPTPSKGVSIGKNSSAQHGREEK